MVKGLPTCFPTDCECRKTERQVYSIQLPRGNYIKIRDSGMLFSCTLLFLCNKDILSFLILQFRNQFHHATLTAICKWQFKIAVLWTLFNDWINFSECFRTSGCSWCTSDKNGNLVKGFCDLKEICPSQQCLKDGMNLSNRLLYHRTIWEVKCLDITCH